MKFFLCNNNVIKFTPIFKDTRFCDILISNIKHYQRKYKFVVLGFVIMPSHFHWIVQVNPEYGTISEIMRDIKKFTTWQIFDLMEKEEIYRQEINIFCEVAVEIKDQARKLWMKRFDDEVIRDQEMFWTKLSYIHNTPLKSGLALRVEDYKYSSARNYIYDDHSILEVSTEMGGVDLYKC